MFRFLWRIAQASSIGLLAVMPASAAVAATTDFAAVFPADALSANTDVQAVNYKGSAAPGSIEVHTRQRRLYYVIAPGRALRYTVGVGRIGQQWFGATSVARMQLRPDWIPPVAIRGSKPAIVIPASSPKNPMGAAALVLADHDLGIHGTNDPKSVGHYVSWGCIRMQNRDIMDLYARVSVGTPVIFKR
jgi:lipoprotein-anchoring transpeptidase ErfK/SrfK